MWEVDLSRTVMKSMQYAVCTRVVPYHSFVKKFSDCLPAECFENMTPIYCSVANTKSNRQLLPPFLKPALRKTGLKRGIVEMRLGCLMGAKAWTVSWFWGSVSWAAWSSAVVWYSSNPQLDGIYTAHQSRYGSFSEHWMNLHHGN
ncbi:hypothetical protein AKJ16_DCAP06220 [Drosera capensis]